MRWLPPKSTPGLYKRNKSGTLGEGGVEWKMAASLHDDVLLDSEDLIPKNVAKNNRKRQSNDQKCRWKRRALCTKSPGQRPGEEECRSERRKKTPNR